MCVNHHSLCVFLVVRWPGRSGWSTVCSTFMYCLCLSPYVSPSLFFVVWAFLYDSVVSRCNTLSRKRICTLNTMGPFIIDSLSRVEQVPYIGRVEYYVSTMLSTMYEPC